MTFDPGLDKIWMVCVHSLGSSRDQCLTIFLNAWRGVLPPDELGTNQKRFIA